MTLKEFVSWAQRYYGPYPEGQKKDIAEYLQRFSSEYLDALKTTVMKRYSSKWGRPPDVAIFVECSDETLSLIQYKRVLKPAIAELDEDLITPEQLKALKELFASLDEKGGRHV